MNAATSNVARNLIRLRQQPAAATRLAARARIHKTAKAIEGWRDTREERKCFCDKVTPSSLIQMGPARVGVRVRCQWPQRPSVMLPGKKGELHSHAATSAHQCLNADGWQTRAAP